jgi:glycosyltransferase involved in cell wall biosynthesis
MVIVEAMACGLAVVSFDCPWGPSSIIADGEDGLLVEDGNTDKMAETLAELMANPDKQRMLSNHAVQNVQRFQMDRIATQWKNLFESLL